MKVMIRTILFTIVAGVVNLAASGCAAVKPYEREFLADRIMAFDGNLEETVMERHFLLTREGSMGGQGGAGGGCACN